MTDKPAKRTRPTYTDEQIELALIAVAYNNGNSGQAARDLKSTGLKIDQRTLRSWSRQQHVERYERVRAEVLPPLRARAAETFRDIAARQGEVAYKMTDRLNKEVNEIPAKDLPKGVQAVTTAAAISVDKAEKLDDQPAIVVQRDVTEVLRELKSIGVTLDGTAVEETIEDAQLVEG